MPSSLYTPLVAPIAHNNYNYNNFAVLIFGLYSCTKVQHNPLYDNNLCEILLMPMHANIVITAATFV